MIEPELKLPDTMALITKMRERGYGCSDGGCIFGHPGGLHTNGGCNCARSMPPNKLAAAVRKEPKTGRWFAECDYEGRHLYTCDHDTPEAAVLAAALEVVG